MAMHRVPTLVLGIGGIGCRIAANISDLLTDEARERVGIVGMDTNVNDLTAVAARGVRTIQTSDERTVGEFLINNPQHMPWFPLNAFTASKSLLNGAGQIRAVSRLGALATEERGGFIPIKEEIQRIRINRGDSSNGNLTVMIVGSITGGTGAGLFLQMPYYIRKLMADETGLKNIIIRGMFVGPDLTEGPQPGPIQKAAVRVNAYSCLKELNALYMRQLSPQQGNNLNIDFYTPVSEEEKRDIVGKIHNAWADLGIEGEDYSMEAIGADANIIAQGNPDVPYDYLYLVEGTTSEGDTGRPPLDNVESLVARMVHTLMFTPVANNALSVEDNMILQDAAHKGMNRYSGAGMKRLLYPQDLAREYVTLCAVRDTVQSEWMVIDDAFQDVLTEALSRQKTDGKAELPQLKTSYITLFDDKAKKNGPLNKLFSEAYYKIKNVDTRRSQQFLMALDDMVSGVMTESDVKNTANACALDTTRMKAYKTATKEVNRVYESLDEYEALAKRLVTERPASIANKLFPPSWPSMRQSIENPQADFCDIYQLIHDVHPLTARFLCYDLIQELEWKIADLDGSQDVVFDGYKNQDFDASDDEVQSPTQAIANIKKKQIPVIGSLISEGRRLGNFTLQFDEVARGQKTLIDNYLQNAMMLSVCKILLPRLEALAENYAIFFRSIGQMIEENQTRISSLENLKFPLGDIGVFCSKEAFQQIAAEYQNSTNIGLTDETKSAIFVNLFKVLAEDLSNSSKVATERQKAARATKKAKALQNIFSVAVVDTIRTDVIKKGSDIVDMNVYTALQRQFELEAPERDDFPVYLQEQIRKAMKMAAPMVATSANAAAENTATAYIAMHPDCAASVLGKADKGETEKMFAPNACDETGNVKVAAMLDDAFSPQELICFRARYKFSIEDLVKYKPGSQNAECYNKRIRSLGTAPLFTGDPDDGLTVINPHLDRYWHEEAFLPSMYESEREKNKMDLAKAFVYALGMDYFILSEDDSALDKDGNSRLTWYYQTGRGFAPIKVRNGYIGNSYTDLYNALPYNGRIKNRILKLNQWNMAGRKGHASAEELFELIMSDPFIEDLIQSRHDEANKEDRNVLDVLLSMRGTMAHNEWCLLFTGLREVLFEYCAFMFDKNERMVNVSVRSIIDAMVANSSISGKAESELTFAEKDLNQQIKNLRGIAYKAR